MPDYNMLFQGPNAGQAFAQAFEHAQERKQQNALMQQQMQEHQADREAQQQQQASQQQQALIAQHRDSILLGGKIIRQIQPKDDASWQQAKALYVQAGGDPTDIPDHFDQQYVQGISSLADALDPQAAQRPQIVTTQAGGGVFRIDPATGQAIPLIMPNDGSHAPGSSAAPPPPQGFVIDGGQSQSGSGNFPQ